MTHQEQSRQNRSTTLWHSATDVAPQRADSGAGLPKAVEQIHNLREEFCEYVHALFKPSDVIEIRAIESWQFKGKKTSRLVERAWLSPAHLVESYEHLNRLKRTQNANIFIGVNPRINNRTHRVQQVRCLWADIDGILPDTVLSNLPFVLPLPSVVVSSGNGTHLYWKLLEPLDVSNSKTKQSLEAMLRRLYVSIGGDTVQNIDRLFRLPGFQNTKDARNGRPSSPCTLVRCSDVTYLLSAFGAWMQKTEVQVNDTFIPGTGLNSMDHRTRQRVKGLIAHLDLEVSDRSKRDFAVTCGLIRLGIVSPNELASILSGKSKFKDNEFYLKTTIENALKSVRGP